MLLVTEQPTRCLVNMSFRRFKHIYQKQKSVVLLFGRQNAGKTGFFHFQLIGRYKHGIRLFDFHLPQIAFQLCRDRIKHQFKAVVAGFHTVVHQDKIHISVVIFCLHEGIASAGDIDAVMKLGMNHPIGPLALADLIGLDTCLAIMDVLYHELRDSKYRACPLLVQMVDAGQFGRKTAKGFYGYES